MGQCYAVYLQVKFKDEEGAKKALQEKIQRADAENVNYSLDHFKSLGKSTDNLRNLLELFFAGWSATFDPVPDPELLVAGFDACYGWESVMMDAFEIIAPFLEDHSWIKIYPDYRADKAIVRDGKAEWHP